jgi:hypothetical protein
MYSLLPDDMTAEASLFGKGFDVVALEDGGVTRWDVERASALSNAVDDEESCASPGCPGVIWTEMRG